MRTRLAPAAAVLALLLLPACSGDADETGGDTGSESTPSTGPDATDPVTGVPPVVGPGPRVSYDEIAGATLTIDPTAARDPLLYRTVAISAVSARPDDKIVRIDYESGPESCSLAVGYAVDRTRTELAVTVIEAQTEECEGDPVAVTTRIPVGTRVGDLDVVPSEFSEQSLAITDIPT